MDQRIADYIRDHRGKYTREALTQQLLDAGYTREGIDATWAVLDTPDPDDTAGEGFWGRFFLVLIGINVAVLVLVGLGTGSFSSPDRLGLLAILGVALGIGALIAWGVVALVGPSRMGRNTAMVIGFGIPLVFSLLIGGSCYALLSALGPPPRSGTLEVEIEEEPTLSRTGTATCILYSGGAFSVSGELPGTPYVSVFVDNQPPNGPVTGEVETVSVYADRGTGTEQSQSWSTYAGPAELASEVDGGGGSGSVTFIDLPAEDLAEPEFEGPEVEPISGTITWNCD